LLNLLYSESDFRNWTEGSAISRQSHDMMSPEGFSRVLRSAPYKEQKPSDLLK